MIDTETLPCLSSQLSLILAIVNEIPSIAIEPFLMQYFNHFFSTLTSNNQLSSIDSLLIIVATVSTCPCTICPSKPSLTFSGISIFTFSKHFIDPKFVFGSSDGIDWLNSNGDIVKSNKLNLNGRLSVSEVINKVYDKPN